MQLLSVRVRLFVGCPLCDGVRLFILDLRIRLKGLRPSPSPPTMPLKFKPGEETSVIEGLRAEVPGIPPPAPLPCAAEKPWAGCFGRGKTLGGLFWLRKNRAGAILAADKPCARAHSGILTYRLCIFGT